jgi:hypothetical protein
MQLKLYPLAGAQRLKTSLTDDLGKVYKNIGPAVRMHNKTITLFGIKPLNNATTCYHGRPPSKLQRTFSFAASPLKGSGTTGANTYL